MSGPDRRKFSKDFINPPGINSQKFSVSVVGGMGEIYWKRSQFLTKGDVIYVTRDS